MARRPAAGGLSCQCRLVAILSAIPALAVAPVVAQVAGEAGRPAAAPVVTAPSGMAADGRNYVIPFVVLTDVETDFGPAPPAPDDALRDASVDTPDTEAGRRRPARQNVVIERTGGVNLR